MNMKILLAIPISLLTVACAPQLTVGCQTMSVRTQCTHMSQKVTITVLPTPAGGLVISPRSVCAKPDTDVNFQVTPANTKIIVAIGAKDPLADPWLNGASNPPVSNTFTVHVPASAPMNTDHDYIIVATNGSCYDPRIRVDPGS
jgi:hypothetical protein